MSTSPDPQGPVRERDWLVLTEGVRMPRRCPVCNSEDVVPKRLRVTFAVSRKRGLVGPAVNKLWDAVRGWNYTGPVKVGIYFCRRHRARFDLVLLIAIILLLLGGAGTITLMILKAKGLITLLATVPFGLGLILTLGALTGALNVWFKPRHFHDRTVWVSGASPQFLASLPDLDQFNKA